MLDMVWEGAEQEDERSKARQQAWDWVGLISSWLSEEYQEPAFCIGFTQTCE